MRLSTTSAWGALHAPLAGAKLHRERPAVLFAFLRGLWHRLQLHASSSAGAVFGARPINAYVYVSYSEGRPTPAQLMHRVIPRGTFASMLHGKHIPTASGSSVRLALWLTRLALRNLWTVGWGDRCCAWSPRSWSA